MRVLICGSRTYDDWPTMLWFCRTFKNGDVLIEGEAPGADTLARKAVEAIGMAVKVLKFPAEWTKFGRAAGPLRNMQMLREGKPELVVAFVDKPLSESRGTANMVTQAKEAGLPVYVVQRV